MDKRTEKHLYRNLLRSYTMPYCINCGSEVGAEDRMCRDCGYDPKVKGRRIRPDRTSIESYAQAIDEAERVSKNAEKVVCRNCFKSFNRKLEWCPNCSEKNAEKEIPSQGHSDAKRYAAFTALALLAMIAVFSVALGV